MAIHMLTVIPIRRKLDCSAKFRLFQINDEFHTLTQVTGLPKVASAYSRGQSITCECNEICQIEMVNTRRPSSSRSTYQGPVYHDDALTRFLIDQSIQEGIR